MNIESVTLICGLAMNLMPLLHIRTMVKNKTSIGQSIPATVILFIGFIVWFLYSLNIRNNMMITTNAIGTWVSCIYMCTTIYYRLTKCLQSNHS